MQVSRTTFEMVKEQDAYPDLSFIGEYSNQPGDKAHTVDREKRGDMNLHEYRYFIAAMSGAETGNRLSVWQDYKRYEAYNNGDWCMMYIRAKVTLEIPMGNGHTITQEIESPGLFGIESDSDDDYFAEVFKDECAVLEEMLKAMGTIEMVD